MVNFVECFRKIQLYSVSICSRFKYVHDLVIVTQKLTDAGATNMETILVEVGFLVRFHKVNNVVLYHFFNDFYQV